MTARRELQLAVALCLLGSLLVLWAAGRTWLVHSADALTIRDLSTAVPGTTLSPATRALGVVGVVGVLALAATRSWGRVVVGVLLLLAGLGVLVATGRVLTAAPAALVPVDCGGASGCYGPVVRVGPDGSAEGVRRSTAWPLTALAGGVLLSSAGLLVALRGRRWSGLSSAYDAPTVPPAPDAPGAPVPGAPSTPTAAAPGAPEEEPVSDKAVWDALDRGHDPTT